MSRNIHESVAGVNLFVPDANDYFSIIPAAMPNGDPALCINPNNLNNPDYKAYAMSPILVPDVMRQAGSAFSLSLWVKQPVGVGSQDKAATIFKIQNSAAGNSATGSYPLTCFVQQNINGLFQCGIVGWKIPVARIANFPNPGNAGTTAWVFCVFRVPAPGSLVSTYIGGDSSIVNTAATVSSGTETFSTDNRFALGRYSDGSFDAGMGNTPGQNATKAIYVGKLCFHDHLLTLAECQALYLAMTT